MSEPIRVLVVDDSPLNRNELLLALATCPEAKVVGCAGNGAEALQKVKALRPDLITLDLQMPKLDGFEFLRILPSVWRCPVIVVSSCAGSKQVFKALELGAVDFVAKPETSAERVEQWSHLLQEKLRVVQSLATHATGVPPPLSSRKGAPPPPALPASTRAHTPRRLVALTASTGGPAALNRLVGGLKPNPNCAILIAQHMPETFTTAFAEALDARSAMTVREAQLGDRVLGGQILICPGRKCMEVRSVRGGWVVDVFSPGPRDRYAPSGDRLLRSTAAAAGRHCAGVVLTGMGDDGLEGARAVAEHSGLVMAEDETTAVVYGMPRAVIEQGLANHVLPVGEIAPFLNGWVREPLRSPLRREP